VFDYCSDLSHEPEWSPMMKRIEKVSHGPVGVGTRFATEFAKGPEMVIEYTNYERPEQWASVGDSAVFRASGSGSVVPVPEGSHLFMRMELEPRGLRAMATPFLRRRMQSMYQRDVNTIKALLEGDGGNHEGA
jgi:hypothetical protein